MYVLDTNVLVAALSSRLGASNFLLGQAIQGRLSVAVSVALALEYEAVLTRRTISALSWATRHEVLSVLDSLFAAARLVHPIYFRQRPASRDPADDMVLECAVQAQAQAIVTLNRSDFAPAAKLFGIQVLKPGELAAILKRTNLQ